MPTSMVLPGTLRQAALVTLLLLAATVGAFAQPSLVILVRHAERDSVPAQDPALTAAGVDRATELARILSQARVGSIITTQYQRTRLTAQPLARELGLAPVVVGADSSVAEHANAVASAVLSRPLGEVVLVIGHTLTVPAIISALGGPRCPRCERDYATLFLLHLPGAGPPPLVRATYGAATKAPAECP